MDTYPSRLDAIAAEAKALDPPYSFSLDLHIRDAWRKKALTRFPNVSEAALDDVAEWNICDNILTSKILDFFNGNTIANPLFPEFQRLAEKSERETLKLIDMQENLDAFVAQIVACILVALFVQRYDHKCNQGLKAHCPAARI